MRSHLDIAVAGLGAGGFDAQGEQGVVVLHEVESGQDALLKLGLAHDEVVARRHHDGCLRVERGDMVGGPGDGGGGIATAGLGQYLTLLQLG